MIKRRKLANRATPPRATTIFLGVEQRSRLDEMKGEMGLGEAIERLIDRAYLRGKRRNEKLTQVIARTNASDKRNPMELSIKPCQHSENAGMN